MRTKSTPFLSLALLLLAGTGVASAQTLSAPLVDAPNESLSPSLDQPIETLPPAASNLLAPTSGNEIPSDDLGASLLSTPSNPFVSAAAGDRPAAAVDTMVRGTSQVGGRSQGQLSSRGLYTAAQAAQWAGSGPTPTMSGVQLPGVRASMPASTASTWGLAASSAGAATAVAMATQTTKVATARKLARKRGLSSGLEDSSSPFQFQPASAETLSAFGQTPFDTLGSQTSFLNPDPVGLLYPLRTLRKSPDSVGLPGQNEMGNLQSQLHPPNYSSSYGKKTTRVTMKSLIEQESQPDTTAPPLPPIFFMSQ